MDNQPAVPADAHRYTRRTFAHKWVFVLINDLNPYSPGSPRSGHPIERQRRAAVRPWIAFATLVAVFGALAGCSTLLLLLFTHGYHTTAYGLITAALLTLPLVTNSPWRHRVGFVCGAPIGIAGAFAGSALYVSLFDLSWFNSIFNDEALGPVGMTAFTLGGALLAGLPFFLLIQYVFRTRDKLLQNKTA